MPSFLMSDGSESLRSLTKNELQYVSKLFRLLTKNEQIAHSLICLQNTSDSHRKPMSEFPALHFLNFFLHNINLNVKKKNHVSSLPSPLYIWNLMYFISVQFV